MKMVITSCLREFKSGTELCYIYLCVMEKFSCSFVSTFQHCEKSKKQVPEGLEKRSKDGFVCTISVTFGEKKSHASV